MNIKFTKDGDNWSVSNNNSATNSTTTNSSEANNDGSVGASGISTSSQSVAKVKSEKNRSNAEEAFLKATNADIAEMAATLWGEKKRKREKIMSVTSVVMIGVNSLANSSITSTISGDSSTTIFSDSSTTTSSDSTTTTSSDSSTTTSSDSSTSTTFGNPTTSVSNLPTMSSNANWINHLSFSGASGAQMRPQIYPYPPASDYQGVPLKNQSMMISRTPPAAHQFYSLSNRSLGIYNNTSSRVGNLMIPSGIKVQGSAYQRMWKDLRKPDNSSFNYVVNPNKRANNSSINSSDNSGILNANLSQQISVRQVLSNSMTNARANVSSDMVIQKIKKLKVPTNGIADASLTSDQPFQQPSQNLHQPSQSQQLYQHPSQQVYQQPSQIPYKQSSKNKNLYPQPSLQLYQQRSQQRNQRWVQKLDKHMPQELYQQRSQQLYQQPFQQLYQQPPEQLYQQSSQLYLQPAPLFPSQPLNQQSPINLSAFRRPLMDANVPVLNPSSIPSNDVPLSLDEGHRIEMIVFGNGTVSSSSSFPPDYGHFPMMLAINSSRSADNISVETTSTSDIGLDSALSTDQRSTSRSDVNSPIGSDQSHTSQSEDNDQGGSDRSHTSQSEDNAQGGSDRSHTSQSEDNAQGGSDRSHTSQSEDNTQGGSDRSHTSQSEDNTQGGSDRSHTSQSEDNTQGGSDRSHTSQSEDNAQGGSNESYSAISDISGSSWKSKGSPVSSNGNNSDQNISFHSDVNDYSGQDSMMEEGLSFWKVKTLIKETIEGGSPLKLDEKWCVRQRDMNKLNNTDFYQLPEEEESDDCVIVHAATKEKPDDCVRQRDMNKLNNTDSYQLPEEEESDDCVIVHAATKEKPDDVIISCTKWAHHYSGDVVKAEICYLSVVGYCNFEDIGCPKLHATQHFHWQVKSTDGLWVNLRPDQVIVLEKCYCDPNIDEVEVPMLDPSTLDKSLKGLLKLLKGRRKWKAVFDSMIFVSLSDLSDSLPLRRLCTEAVVDVTSTTSEGEEVQIYNWQVKGTSKQWVYLFPEQSSVLEEAFVGLGHEGIEIPAIDHSMTKLNKFMSSHLTYLLGLKTWIANLDQLVLVDEEKTTTLNLRRHWTENAPTGDTPAECLYSWYFKDKRNKWVEYGFMDSTRDPKLQCKIDSETIEKHYQDSAITSMSIQNDQFNYSLDLLLMEQTNLSTNVKRQIKRRPKPHLKSDGDVDKITDDFMILWDDMQPHERAIRVKLNPNSEEYRKISSLFHDCWNNQTALQATVIDIERVQNPYLWKAFKNKIQELEIVYKDKDKVNIQLLFHGTKGEYLDNICQENFDWRLHGSNVGHAHGKGTYFSPFSSTSYAYCSPQGPPYGIYSFYQYNVNGNKYMFVAEVAVGQIVVGHPNMARPPQNPYSISLYDSTVDRVPQPSIVVKYDKQEYYPKYILTLS